MRSAIQISSVVLVSVLLGACSERLSPVTEEDQAKADHFLKSVEIYADAVFAHGMDNLGKRKTPLFLDGIELDTLKPVVWRYDDHEWIPANLANQQYLLRTFVGLSKLTGDPKYENAAKAALQFGFDELQTANGLFLWGGHTSYDAAGDEWVGRRYHWLGKKRSPIHELKSCFPFYELMWDIDKDATRRFIRVFWKAHVRDWGNLDFDRHGGVESPKSIDRSVWDHEFDANGDIGFIGKGRTFANAGSDLIYAAGMLYALDGEKPALDWAYRLAGQYDKTRDPKTGLRGYQFSRPVDDRAEVQFGDVFPDKLINESRLFEPNYMASPIFSQLRLAESLGKSKGAPFLEMALSDLRGIATTAFNHENGRLRRMLLDGTDLSTMEMPRDGYFGPKGKIVGDWPSDDYFMATATALRMTGENDSGLWNFVRDVAKVAGLGDLGAIDGSESALDFETKSSDPEMIIGLLELHKLTENREFLDLAAVIGENVLKNRFKNGFFKQEGDYRYTRISQSESLALIHLAAAFLKRSDKVPRYLDSLPYFACEIKSSDAAYSFDHNVIYAQPNSQKDPSTSN